jgi:UDP-GlcNAc:undecaprenyl-phosphate GlcNAc-1-phosphate transferase
MSENSFIILIFIILNLCIYKFKDKIFKYIPIFDFPDDERKRHSSPTLLHGGTIFYINIILLTILLYFFPISNLGFSKYNLISIFILLSLFYFLGLADDIFDISPYLKTFFSFFFILFFLNFNPNFIITVFKFDIFQLDISTGSLGIYLTVLSILLFSNAFNMFDGSNLQISSYILCILLFFIIKINENIIFILFLIPCFFFMLMNFKNFLFMGNSGTLMLSFIFSIIFIHFYNNNIVFNYCEEIFLIMLIPGIDMLRVFIFRIMKNKNPFSADSEHIHHLLSKVLLSNNKVQLVIFFANFLAISLVYFKVNSLLSFLIIFSIYTTLIFYGKKLIVF